MGDPYDPDPDPRSQNHEKIRNNHTEQNRTWMKQRENSRNNKQILLTLFPTIAKYQ